MSKQPAFWDSSALVPLCVHESATRQAHAQLRKFLPVVWRGSPVCVLNSPNRSPLDLIWNTLSNPPLSMAPIRSRDRFLTIF